MVSYKPELTCNTVHLLVILYVSMDSNRFIARTLPTCDKQTEERMTHYIEAQSDNSTQIPRVREIEGSTALILSDNCYCYETIFLIIYLNPRMVEGYNTSTVALRQT
jgi:hypothetical protein